VRGFYKNIMEKIKEAAASFSEITGTPVTCFNTKGEILWECPGYGRVCDNFDVYSEPDSVCRNNLQSSIRIAAQLGEPYIFSCRAGLTNIAFSLLIDKRVAGCLVAGPILTGSEKASSLSVLFGNCILGALTPNPDYLKIGEHHNEMQKIAEKMRKYKVEIRELNYQGNSRVIKQAVEFIHENHKGKIALNDMAKNLHISPTYLSMLFKQETGFTITEFLNQVRIAKSRELLSETDMSLLDISEQSGFEDQSYFSKVFKKISGVTPKEYRSIAKGSSIVYDYKKTREG